jgi:hypothetical protein
MNVTTGLIPGLSASIAKGSRANSGPKMGAQRRGAAAHRAQADALEIEAGAKRCLGRKDVERDPAEAWGPVARRTGALNPRQEQVGGQARA